MTTPNKIYRFVLWNDGDLAPIPRPIIDREELLAWAAELRKGMANAPACRIFAITADFNAPEVWDPQWASEALKVEEL